MLLESQIIPLNSHSLTARYNQMNKKNEKGLRIFPLSFSGMPRIGSC